MAETPPLSSIFTSDELDNPNSFNNDGLSLLHRALEDDDIPAAIVEQLIKHGADVNLVSRIIPKEHRKSRKRTGSTPLRFACKSDNLKKLKLLLKHGADISVTSSSNYSPALDATYWALSSSIDAVRERLELLKSQGADFEIASNYGETPLKVAASRNCQDLVSLLLDLGAKIEPLQWNLLFEAIAFMDANSVQNVAKNSPELLATTDFAERSPLRFSVMQGDFNKVKVLVEAGADPLEKGKFSQSLLIAAIEVNSGELCQYFINKGVSIDELDEF